MKRLNERIALWVVDHVGTMACAWIFGVIALTALPQAFHDSFTDGVHPLPIVTWLSQSFLQLVLLSIIMVGQALREKKITDHSTDLHAALHSQLHEHHRIMHDKIDDHHEKLHKRLDAITSPGRT